MIMMIFVTTTDALTDEKLYEKAYSLIPEYRKTKADKMKMYENKAISEYWSCRSENGL